MRPTTDRFRLSLRTSHLVASTCDLFFPGDPDPVSVPVEGGSVQIDRTAQVRRTGNVVIPWSLRAGQDLGLDLRTLPLGGWCKLARGLRYPSGGLELVPLGHYRIESVTWRTSDESASLELADRMAQVKDEPFLAPYTPTVLPSITRGGTLTDDSPVVTGLAQTSDLLVGMTVTGTGVIPGSKILSIDSAGQITLTRSAQIHAVKSATVVETSDLFDVGTTSDLFVGMTMHGGFFTGQQVTEIVSPTRGRYNGSWHSESFPNETTFLLPAAQSLTFSGTVLIADVAVEITQEVFGPTINYQKLYAPAIVLGDVFYTGNRAEALHQLALAAGAETYFDANGDYVFDRQAGSSDPVWTIDAGDQGVMVAADESLNRTGVYNGVLFQGQNTATDAPVAALVVDDDPASPTRWGGPFGKAARIEQSSAVQTVGQAQQAAATLLARRLTLTRALTVTSAPNPALEAGDVVTVRFPDGRLETHVIDSLRLALGPVEAQSFVLHAISPPTPDLLQPQQPYGTYVGAAAWRELNQARLVTA